jgi:hypothetical protein
MARGHLSEFRSTIDMVKIGPPNFLVDRMAAVAMVLQCSERLAAAIAYFLRLAI